MSDATQRTGAAADAEFEAFPLSAAQQRLWILDRWNPGRATYNVPAAFAVRGRLDAERLEACLRDLSARHETLRTRFRVVDGEPQQQVAKRVDVRLERVDLRDEPSERRARACEEMLRGAAREPFDLERGPVWRALLVDLDATEQRLLLTFHHIAADGWSLGVLLRELAELYAARGAGRAPELAELPIQYADFAVWQRDALESAAHAAALGYWREQLAGAPLIDLPADRPRPRARAEHGALVVWRSGSGPTDAIASRVRALASETGATPFMLLLAAFQALVFRYTGQDDVSTGTAIAGRTRSELEGLVGFFVNTLVLRTDLSGDPSFRESLRRVREVALAGYEHQEVPFERVVEALAPARDTARTPLVQILFTLQEPQAELALGDAVLRPLEVPTDTAKFDLNVSVREADGGFELAWTYDRDLFTAKTIERMAGQLGTLLRGALESPDTPLSQLPLLDAAERAELARPASAPTRAGPGLARRFEAAAAAFPDRIALTSQVESVRYAELDARANRLAQHLCDCGAGPDVVVGLCLERGVELIVSLLAVLKSGAGYLPLDPDYPDARLLAMTRDAAAPVIVTRSALAERFGEVRVRCVCIDAEADAIAARRAVSPVAERADADPHPENLAYVIYTSGSTGQPKGVGVTQCNATRLFDATRADFGFRLPESGRDGDAGEVWTLFHSCSFDFSVWEIFGALLHGGRLVIVPHETTRDPVAFRALLAEQRVTVLNQTPTAFRELLRADAAGDVGSALALRHVILGGEALDLGSLAPWFARHGDVGPRLVNMYGITETTVHVTLRPLAASDAAAAASEIGRPLADLVTRVLDRSGNLVPIGVPGELHVGGAGLARGYLGRPGLTAERFVPDPFSAEPGARLYRTGDLVRRRADAQLEYLGRIDQQVKLRGFRIELGEIERTLEEHPVVDRAVVVLTGDAADAQSLAAYWVGAESTSSLALRRFARERLPDFMVPSRFERLDAIPMTATGKGDRAALAARGSALAPATTGYVAPDTEAERVLAQLFAAALGLERVGVHDNFFDLGGHSLQAMRAIDAIEQRFGRRFRPAELITQTLGQLAGLVSREAGE